MDPAYEKDFYFNLHQIVVVLYIILIVGVEFRISTFQSCLESAILNLTCKNQ